jgi:hypothetical protein
MKTVVIHHVLFTKKEYKPMKTHYLVIVLLAGALVLSACTGGTPTPPAADPSPVPPAASGSYRQVEGDGCVSYYETLQNIAFPNAKWYATVEPFTDMEGVSGEACVVNGAGTGIEFDQGMEGISIGAAQSLPLGYLPDPAYDADGPTGTQRGYRNGNALYVITVNAEPAPGACDNLTPQECVALPFEKQVFTVKVSMATK